MLTPHGLLLCEDVFAAGIVEVDLASGGGWGVGEVGLASGGGWGVGEVGLASDGGWGVGEEESASELHTLQLV